MAVDSGFRIFSRPGTGAVTTEIFRNFENIIFIWILLK